VLTFSSLFVVALVALTVPGGSEDVMIDLGVRQQLKLVGPQSKF
jgi:hypothetical protein